MQKKQKNKTGHCPLTRMAAFFLVSSFPKPPLQSYWMTSQNHKCKLRHKFFGKWLHHMNQHLVLEQFFFFHSCCYSFTKRSFDTSVLNFNTHAVCFAYGCVLAPSSLVRHLFVSPFYWSGRAVGSDWPQRIRKPGGLMACSWIFMFRLALLPRTSVSCLKNVRGVDAINDK